MDYEFTAVEPEELADNVFKIVGTDWMLISAGTVGSYNSMTASWGTMGVLWGKKICICFVRPSRHTYRFLEENRLFSLSFFEERFRDVLNYCGSHSGRDVDKASETGLKAIEPVDGAVTFEQARMALICRKIYYQDFDPTHFLAEEIEGNYGGKDYHRIYIGELERCFVHG